MPVMFRFILAVACVLAAADAANAQTAFYRAPSSEVAGSPGTLVRKELIDGAPLGATTYRVLYRSTGLDDKPMLVSGVVIVPPEIVFERVSKSFPRQDGGPAIHWCTDSKVFI